MLSPASRRRREPPIAGPTALDGLFAIALSGMSALGPRWSGPGCCRCCSAGTVYTFSIILAVFLVGLGIGSSVGAPCPPRQRVAAGGPGRVPDAADRRHCLDGLQVASSLPYWPIDPSRCQRPETGPWMMFQLDWCAACGPSCRPLSVGREFPPGPGGRRRAGPGSGRLVGGVYAANTVGAIVGALGFSLLIIPLRHAGRPAVLIGLSAARRCSP